MLDELSSSADLVPCLLLSFSGIFSLRISILLRLRDPFWILGRLKFYVIDVVNHTPPVLSLFDHSFLFYDKSSEEGISLDLLNRRSFLRVFAKHPNNKWFHFWGRGFTTNFTIVTPVFLSLSIILQLLCSCIFIDAIEYLSCINFLAFTINYFKRASSECHHEENLSTIEDIDLNTIILRWCAQWGLHSLWCLIRRGASRLKAENLLTSFRFHFRGMIEAEIANFYIAISINQKIFQLNVKMNYPVWVQILKAFYELREEGPCKFKRKPEIWMVYRPA